jgi:hypothetical protein
MKVKQRGRPIRAVIIAAAAIVAAAIAATPAVAGASTTASRTAPATSVAPASRMSSPFARADGRSHRVPVLATSAKRVSSPLTPADARNRPMPGVTAQTESSNWSGYAVTGDYAIATGTWTVPTVIPSANDRYAADWVGIDGFNNTSIIQTGTEEDSVNGQADYYAWWTDSELNDAEQQLKLTVNPGDTMTASVYGNDSDLVTWTTVLTDDTTGQSARGGGRYGGPHESAEFIQEAPLVGGSESLPTELTTSAFSNLIVTPYEPATGSTGQNPDLTVANEIILVQDGIAYYSPSDPVNGDSFTVSYTGNS